MSRKRGYVICTEMGTTIGFNSLRQLEIIPEGDYYVVAVMSGKANDYSEVARFYAEADAEEFLSTAIWNLTKYYFYSVNHTDVGMGR